MTNTDHAKKTKKLTQQVLKYAKGENKNSITQLLNTFIPFIALWVGAYLLMNISYLLSVPLIIVAAGFLIRIFIIFHDCCHGSFFKSKKVNLILGTITGVITLFPFTQWKRDHSIHHATSSNLDKRGTGDIWVFTIEEYQAASRWEKLMYRLYRNPVVMFGLGPIYLFLIKNRFNRKDAPLKERMNTYTTNALIVAFALCTILLVGWQAFLLIQGPIFFISGMLGIWLFYVQHTFEDTYFEEDENWDYVKAAVEGSSYYKLPPLLQWLTGNIGYHHVHHLSPRIPNYKLAKAHNETEQLKNIPTVTLLTSLQSLKFRLWDTTEKRFVGYKALKQIQQSN
ncbi:fatty acid desaturase [Alkalicoccobacillus porphyridii]|uniref:Fatty acid desaturase n=1 Tax=Alkalicoccobacillus porphyridii TaxID=2597270 RepID=A0A553ZX68_9BACI|nr:fatty acid desaturase [Alkalicoccobacillus porphyridii]TSB46042.1 fatty acid desaturase [Alkalicoccobacillus porphyridii]